jgi:micrococcal nuclease
MRRIDPLLVTLSALLLTTAPLRAEDPPEPNYVFWSKLVRIVDGNTVAMDLDLGFGVWIHNQPLTLLEAGSAGQDDEAKAKNNDRIKKLRELLKDPTDLVVRTVKDRDAKPPRYFAEIWVDGENLNEAMRQAFP